MRLLITRPAADAVPLAERLAALGHEVLIDSALAIRFVAGNLPDLSAIRGLLFTSTNGVRAFAAASNRRDLPVFAVGDRTAQAARDAGFASVASAGGDVVALTALVADHWSCERGLLLHGAGSARAGDLAGALQEKMIPVRVETLYEAVPATTLQAHTIAAITAGRLDGILLFSPRTTRQIVTLIEDAGLADRVAEIDLWCLSRAVAEAAAELTFRRVHVAAHPTEAALLAALADGSGAPSQR